MKKSILIVFLLSLIVGCNKNEENSNETSVDCEKLKESLINSNSEKLIFEINKLTDDLTPKPISNDELGHNENIEKLISRLNSSCNNLNAYKVCYACIETLPLQSEIRIEFKFSNNNFIRIIDISTPENDKLKAVRSYTP